jgi:hypothetical protein
MQNASETIRRICWSPFLVCALLGSGALPSAASVRRPSPRYRHAAVAVRRSRAQRHVLRRVQPISARPSYVTVNVRIPSQLTGNDSVALPTPAFPQQVEQRIPRESPRNTAALQGVIRDGSSRGVVGAVIALTNRATGMTRTVSTDADGVFRLADLAPGTYLLLAESPGFESMTRDGLRLDAGDVVTVELNLAPSPASPATTSRLPRMPELGPPLPAEEAPPAVASYRELRRRPDAESGQEIVAPEMLPPAQEVFLAMPDRWNVAMPEWSRYGRSGEYPYVRASHWWDPFNRNMLKGDVPIFGQQTFLNITATADTLVDERRVPATSNISSARPGSSDFFGKANSLRWTKRSVSRLTSSTATLRSALPTGAFRSRLLWTSITSMSASSAL